MAQGWISLYRDIQDNWIWLAEPFSKGQAWVDLLLLANHQDGTIIFSGELIKVKRGEFITSILKLSDRWRWSRGKASTFLNQLQSDGMLVQNRTAHYTTLTIANYEKYQSVGTTKVTAEEQPKSNGKTTKEQRKDINNNDNNANNENNDKQDISSRFSPPTVFDVQAYCNERKNAIDAERFIDYYTAIGWQVGKNKMKDWKAAVRTWEKRNDNPKNGGVNNAGTDNQPDKWAGLNIIRLGGD